MRKGQGATELVILLAVILVVLSLIFIFSQNKITESTNLLRLSQSRSTVNDLAKAVAEVNSEGVGARRVVQITIPDGFNSSRTNISGTTINIGVVIEGTTADVNTRTQTTVVKGVTFPTTPGTYSINVIAKEGYVLIGDSDLSVDPTYISIELLYSNSTTRTINFTNLGSSAIDVTSTLVWSYSEIDAKINDTNSINFVLDVGSNPSQVVLSVNTLTNTTLGVYTGGIDVSTNETESLSIPVVVNVVGTQPSVTGVSYMIVDTYKNSSYLATSTNFTRPTPVNVTSTGWAASSTVTINIFPDSLGSGSSVSGYPQNIATNSSGGFSHQFNPSGYNATTYNISVNQSTSTISTLINITACTG
jgi:hypothetical protein